MITSYTGADLRRGVAPIGRHGAALCMEAPFQLDGQIYIFRDCLVDFAGSYGDPAIAVDLFDGPSGSLLRVTGDWRHYGSSPPAVVSERDEGYLMFFAACVSGDECAYASSAWPST